MPKSVKTYSDIWGVPSLWISFGDLATLRHVKDAKDVEESNEAKKQRKVKRSDRPNRNFIYNSEVGIKGVIVIVSQLQKILGSKLLPFIYII